MIQNMMLQHLVTHKKRCKIGMCEERSSKALEKLWKNTQWIKDFPPNHGTLLPHSPKLGDNKRPYTKFKHKKGDKIVILTLIKFISHQYCIKYSN